MFLLAILIGLYSYTIFTLGITGLLYKNLIIWLTLGFWLIILYIYRKKIIGETKNLKKIIELIIKNKPLLLLCLIFVLQPLINLIGALGPELAFDALWYHLTLPKLYLQNHSVFFIPGGLLYYSAMPKMGEMFYIAGLAFNNEILAKLTHFSFGLLTCLALYKIQRKFFSPFISMIGVLIFYSNLVVAWESITAYIDLFRSFFEIMALWAFINWWDGQKIKWLFLSAVMVGLAISAKLLSVGSLIIFTTLVILKDLKKFSSMPKARNTKYLIINTFIYWLIALAIPLPWFIFSYINTGNPVYPFFTQIYKITPETISFLGFPKEIWNLFTNSPDLLTPLYMIFLPLIIFSFSGFRKEIKIIAVYSILALFVWYFTPRTGGGRFILPYLPAFSILCAAAYSQILKNSRITFIKNFLITIIILVSLISIGYRFAANSKYIPVILGKETKGEFLAKHLNFNFGDFYDTDNFLKNNIKPTDKVLLLGFHNLYYVDFPFIDQSWLRVGDRFNYIATQNTDLPSKYKNWKLIYSNKKTMIKVYKI